MARNPSYLTKNRLGIFIFQCRTPIYIVKQIPNVRVNFRISLRTRNIRKARKLARIWWLIMEEIYKKYFNDAESYGKAIELLARYKDILKCESFDQAEPLLTELNEYEDHLLSKVIACELEEDSIRNAKINEEVLARLKEISTYSERVDSKTESTLTISQTVEKFLEEKRRHSDPKTAVSMEKKEYRPKLKLLIEIVGDKKSGTLIKEDITSFKESLYKLPKNRSQHRAYKGMHINELLKLDIDDDQKISKTTIKNYATKVRIFLQWGIDNGYFQEGIKTPLNRIIKKTQRADEEREPFTTDELKRIFESKQYKECTHKSNAHYWVPLLGLFTGARINELCQLYVEDVKKDQNSKIWYLDINDEKDKKIKNLNSKRTVPIHSKLIKLGFIDYVESLKRDNIERLFIELKRTNEGYSSDFSKWFNRTYLNKNNCNVGKRTNEKKNFHSFRHTFINSYKQLGSINMDDVSELVGHKTSMSVTTVRYSNPLELNKKAELIEKLKFDEISFDLISRQKA